MERSRSLLVEAIARPDVITGSVKAPLVRYAGWMSKYSEVKARANAL
jgi:hypothetical protein